jgi:hypothetical protein
MPNPFDPFDRSGPAQGQPLARYLMPPERSGIDPWQNSIGAQPRQSMGGGLFAAPVPGQRPPAAAVAGHPEAAPQVPVARAAGRWSAAQISDLARRAESLRDEALPYFNGDWNLATGFAANIVLESLGQTNSREQGGGPGRGLMQITNAARKANFRKVMGVDIDHATRDQQYRFALWEKANDHYESKMWRRALSHGSDPASIAAGIARYVERPLNKPRDAAERAAVAAAMPLAPTRR